MEAVRVHDHLGLQVLVLPDGYRFETETVYLVRDGITMVVIPVSEDGERVVQQRRLAALMDPERIALWKLLTEPQLTPQERGQEPVALDSDGNLIDIDKVPPPLKLV
jgi:hypothetical protein